MAAHPSALNPWKPARRLSAASRRWPRTAGAAAGGRPWPPRAIGLIWRVRPRRAETPPAPAAAGRAAAPGPSVHERIHTRVETHHLHSLERQVAGAPPASTPAAAGPVVSLQSRHLHVRVLHAPPGAAALPRPSPVQPTPMRLRTPIREVAVRRPPPSVRRAEPAAAAALAAPRPRLRVARQWPGAAVRPAPSASQVQPAAAAPRRLRATPPTPRRVERQAAAPELMLAPERAAPRGRGPARAPAPLPAAAAPEGAVIRPPLVWRARPPAATAAPLGAEIATVEPGPAARAPGGGAAEPPAAAAAARGRPAPLPALDPAFTARLAEDVMRRIERSLRIERERRGL